MTGVSKIEIIESVPELKNLMKQQKSSLELAKVQALYLWKIQAVETVRHLAVLMGRGERTIHRWLALDREEGMVKLLAEPPRTGRPKKFSGEQAAKVQNELRNPEGFTSYKEVHFWLEIIQDISSSYITVYRLVRDELNAKLKVARPKSKKQLEGEVEEFKATLSKKLKTLLEKEVEKVKRYQTVSFWMGDESRFGLHTIKGRKLTYR